MNDTKQIWQQAKEEFKDRAFERFLLAKCFGNSTERGFNSNDDLELYLESGDLITLKTLQELFAHDVEIYGENAYLMWEFLNLKEDWIDFEDNSDVDYPNIRRKQSVALPFDLERAKAGDVVEYLDLKGNWLVLENHQFISNIDGMITTVLNHANYVTNISNLRMKYPPKVAR